MTAPHVYVSTDIPAGMTLTAWRRSRVRPLPRLSRAQAAGWMLASVIGAIVGLRMELGRPPYRRQVCPCQQPPAVTTSTAGERW